MTNGNVTAGRGPTGFSFDSTKETATQAYLRIFGKQPTTNITTIINPATGMATLANITNQTVSNPATKTDFLSNVPKPGEGSPLDVPNVLTNTPSDLPVTKAPFIPQISGYELTAEDASIILARYGTKYVRFLPGGDLYSRRYIMRKPQGAGYYDFSSADMVLFQERQAQSRVTQANRYAANLATIERQRAVQTIQNEIATKGESSQESRNYYLYTELKSNLANEILVGRTTEDVTTEITKNKGWLSTSKQWTPKQQTEAILRYTVTKDDTPKPETNPKDSSVDTGPNANIVQTPPKQPTTTIGGKTYYLSIFPFPTQTGGGTSQEKKSTTTNPPRNQPSPTDTLSRFLSLFRAAPVLG